MEVKRGQLSNWDRMPEWADEVRIWVEESLVERKLRQTEILAEANPWLARLAAENGVAESEVLQISSSALSRLALARAKVFERHSRAKAMFDGLKAQIDDTEVDETTRLLAEFVKDIVLALSADGEIGSTKNAMEIARAVKDLASAQKISADRRLALEAATKAKLIKAVDAVEGAIGATVDKMDGAEVLRRVREDIYGIFGS
jgi:hypothetical protein